MQDKNKKIYTLDSMLNDIEETMSIEDSLKTISRNKNDDTEINEDALFIEEVLRIGFEPKNEKEPFKPYILTAERRTLSLEDITKDKYELISTFREKVKSFQCKAKLSDILWVGNQDYKSVETALNNYIKTIENFIKNNENKSNILIRKELRRCTSLYRLIKDSDPQKKKLLEIFDILIKPKDEEPNNYTRFNFFKVLAYSKLKENKEFISNAEKYADESKKQKHYRKSRDYLEICIELYKKDKDIINRDKLLNQKCDIYNEEIKEMKESGAKGLVLTDLCSRALYENMMTHKITRSRKEIIDDIHAELNNAAILSQQEMKSIPFNMDLTEPIKETLKTIEDLSTEDGILYLAHKTIPQELRYYYDHAEKTMKGSIHHLFSSIHYGDNGRIIDRDNGLSFDNEDENSSIILSEALNLFKNNVLVKGTCIDHGRNTLLLKHDFNEYHFDAYLLNNPFIPKDRINIIRKALWYGFIGKWEECMYLLTPQFENCVRHFLETVGVIVTLIDEDIIQQERTLSSLFHLPEFKNVFGEEHSFQLKALLSENKGFNFRNRLLHGLINDDFYNSCSYFPPFVWANFIYLSYTLRETFYRRVHNVKNKN